MRASRSVSSAESSWATSRVHVAASSEARSPPRSRSCPHQARRHPRPDEEGDALDKRDVILRVRTVAVIKLHDAIGALAGRDGREPAAFTSGHGLPGTVGETAPDHGIRRPATDDRKVVPGSLVEVLLGTADLGVLGLEGGNHRGHGERPIEVEPLPVDRPVIGSLRRTGSLFNRL